MAEQEGIIPLRRTIGKITFTKTKQGYMAMARRSKLSKEAYNNDPAFQRTRENGAEFGRAGKAGKVLRTAFRVLTINASDHRMVGRLTRRFVQVIQADATNARGLRNVIDGEAELLHGFEFNDGGQLGTTMFAPFTAAIDRVTGQLTVSFEPFTPKNMLNVPAGTTHFALKSAGAAINFEEGTYEVATSSSVSLPWNNTPTAAITLTNQVAPNSTHPLVLVLGVEFYQEVNGINYPLKAGAFNALAVVKVSGL